MANPHTTEELAARSRRETGTERKNFRFKPSIVSLLANFAASRATSDTNALETAVKSAIRLIPILKELACTKEEVAGIILHEDEGDEEQIAGWVNLAALYQTREGDFLWKVTGESMTGGGVEKGDYLLIRPQGSCDNGELVIVMIDTATGKIPALRKVRFTESQTAIELVSLRNEADVLVSDTATPETSLPICGVKRGIIKGS